MLTERQREIVKATVPLLETGGEALITHFYQTMLGDVYVVMGDTAGDGARAVRLYYNPFVNFIWLGAAIMFAGGLLSLSDRRYRVGAPKRAIQAQAVPAE